MERETNWGVEGKLMPMLMLMTKFWPRLPPCKLQGRRDKLHLTSNSNPFAPASHAGHDDADKVGRPPRAQRSD